MPKPKNTPRLRYQEVLRFYPPSSQILAQMFLLITSCYNKHMSEEESGTPLDRSENAGPQSQPPESGPTDAQRGAVEDLADKVDDNKVEAAGKEGGLRGALATRLGIMRSAIENHRNSNEAYWKGPPSMKGASRILRPSAIVLGHALTWPTMRFAERTASFLRDRLQPKTQAQKEPQTVSK